MKMYIKVNKRRHDCRNRKKVFEFIHEDLKVHVSLLATFEHSHEKVHVFTYIREHME